MQLAEATWTDVEDLDAELVLLPVGSTEQHGPHAPLGTDWLIAEAIAEGAAAASDLTTLVAPTIPIGVAEEHRRFPGTMWVSPGTFRRYVREAMESLAEHGLDRIILVNGHGGNVDALREVCQRVTRDGTCFAAPVTWFETIGEVDHGMGHGGPLETSLVWHIKAALIREGRLGEARDGASDRWGEWVAGVNLAVDTDQFSANGVVGDPSRADPELGAELLERSIDALLEVMRAVEAGDDSDSSEAS